MRRERRGLNNGLAFRACDWRFVDRVLYLGRGQAALGTVDEVITGPVLSRLYGSEIEVVRLKGRIFVMSGGYEVERDEHRHNDRSMHAQDLQGMRQGDA
jgi:zinc/manganese transport system ATP-binding protein